MVITQQPRTKERWAPCGRRENVQDYYVPRRGKSDYTDYFSVKTDPDGVIRFRDSEPERRQFVEDNRETIDFINALAPVSVLDFGAGLGWMLGEIRAGCKAAVEIAPEAIAALRQAGTRVFEELAEISSASFECVIAHHVFEHLVDPIYSLNHIHRILHKGGWLVLGMPDFGCPCAKRFGDNFRLLHDPTHVSLFTLESATRMLRDYGFSIERVAFPFPERYATPETMARWNDTSKVSPPWPGNVFNLFARRQ